MFRQLDNPDTPVAITVDGTSIVAAPGSTVAAALLINGIEQFGQASTGGTPRAPYCLMGVCNDCLVEIDTQPGQLACQVRVRDGMAVRRRQKRDGDG